MPIATFARRNNWIRRDRIRLRYVEKNENSTVLGNNSSSMIFPNRHTRFFVRVI